MCMDSREKFPELSNGAMGNLATKVQVNGSNENLAQRFALALYGGIV